jgi:hypothetical protein
MRALEFTNASAGSEKEVFYNVHINHEYVMGTKVYLHVHWNNGNTTSVSTIGWGFQYAVTKGHQQQAMSTTGTTVYVSHTMLGTQYMHYVSEVSDTFAVPATNLEPDSIISVRLFRDSANAGGTGDTYTGSVWLLFVDCHYLSNSGGTTNKAPSFYV